MERIPITTRVRWMLRWIGKWLLAPFVFLIYKLSPSIQRADNLVYIWIGAYLIYLALLEILSRKTKSYETSWFRMTRIQAMIVFASLLVLIDQGTQSPFWFIYLWPILVCATSFSWRISWSICAEIAAFYVIACLLAADEVRGIDLAILLTALTVLGLMNLVFAEALRRSRGTEGELWYAQILQDVQRDVDTAQTLQEVLDRVVTRAIELVGARDGTLMLVNQAGELSFEARSGNSLPVGKIEHTFKSGEGVAGWVLKNQAPYVCSDTRTDPHFVYVIAGSVPIRSMVCVPIISHGRALGVINVDHKESNHFSVNDAKLLITLANATAASIERAKLLGITAALSANLELEQVADKILDGLSKLIRYRTASMQLLEGDFRRQIAGRQFESDTVPDWALRPISEDCLIRRIVQTKRITILSDLSGPNRDPAWEVHEETKQVMSWIGVPLIFGDEVIGLLTLDHASAGYYQDTDRPLLQAFADQATIAIHNAQLYKRVQKRQDVLRRLLDIGKDVSRLDVQEPKRSLERIPRDICEDVRADCVVIYPFDPAPDRQRYYDTRNVASFGLWHRPRGGRQATRRRHKPADQDQ